MSFLKDKFIASMKHKSAPLKAAAAKPPRRLRHASVAEDRISRKQMHGVNHAKLKPSAA